MGAARAAVSSLEEYQEELVEETPSNSLTPDRLVGGRRARIMLAEDDEEMRTLLVERLTRDGYEVIAAQNGLQMIEEIRMLLFRGDPMPVDLIVSDERMPGMPGLEFLSILRQAEWPTPFILITGFGDESTHERALRMGASAVFDKPFDIDELRRTVLAVLLGDGSVLAAGAAATPAPVAHRNNPGME
jgi:two-component system, response regulator, stage 0 sporulation protein F